MPEVDVSSLKMLDFRHGPAKSSKAAWLGRAATADLRQRTVASEPAAVAGLMQMAVSVSVGKPHRASIAEDARAAGRKEHRRIQRPLRQRGPRLGRQAAAGSMP